MAAPNIDTRFATATNYTADGDDWGGEPTKIDPGAPRRAEGFEPDSLPAEWLNWILGALGAWVYWFAGRLGGLTGSGEWSYETPRARTLVVPGMAIVNGLTSPGWTVDEAGGALCHVNSVYANLDLGAWIPSDSVLTNIVVYTSAAHTSTAGIQFKVYGSGVDGSGTAQIGSTFNSPTTAIAGTATLGAGTYTLTRNTHRYYLEIKASDQAATSAPGDRIYGILLYFNDIGPRND